MLNNILYSILRISIISLYTTILGIIISPVIFSTIGLLTFHRSYIETINTPTYGNLIKQYLQEFNKLGNNQAVNFNKEYDGRPIYIYEMTNEMEEESPQTLGATYSRYGSCITYLKKDLSPKELREVLFHEYLHCFGYNHTEDPKDLMYYANEPVDKEDNIRHYAIEVGKKFYEPRFYRF